MDWLQFFSSIVSSLAWPGVVAYLLYLLRAQLGSLAERLTELSLPGGTKALFDKGLKDAKNDVIVLAARTEGSISTSEPKDQTQISATTAKQIAEKLSPRKSIAESLINLTNHIRGRIDELPLSMRREPYDFVFETLRKEVGGVELYSTFTKLREMSSAAYNSSEESITKTDAKSYADICAVFIASFDRVFDEWRSRTGD